MTEPQWEACKICGGDHWTKDHDPALRALLTNRQVPDANRITITVGELRRLAAAAAPLDVAWMHMVYEDRSRPHDYIKGWNDAIDRVARHIAATSREGE